MAENPAFQGHRLRDRLRKAREAAGLTQREVAERLDWSPSKIIRIESGKIRVTVTDTMALVSHYGIEPSQAQEYTELARAARQLPWYAPYRSVTTPELQAYLAYESSASIIRNFEANLIPGLLQIEGYTRSILGALAEENENVRKNLDLLLQLRMERQERTLQPHDREFFFVIDEGALRRVVGSAEVMRQQYERLLEANSLPNVTVLAVPFEAGPYPHFRAPYVVFEFPEDEDDIVAYVENPDGEVLLSEKSPGSDRKQPADYLDIFWKVEKGVAKEVTSDFLFR